MRISRWTAVLLLAAPLAAQVDEKVAVAHFKADTKPLLKDFKATSTELKGVLTDAIEQFEDDLPGAVDPFDTANTLAEALRTFHSGLRGLLQDVSLATDVAWQGALADFSGGAALNGLYPEGLVNGDGGAVDDFRTSVDKHVAKLITSINKRLDKAEKSAESDGFGLLAWSGTPQGLLPSAASEEGSSSSFPPLTVDIIVSLSDLAASNDGHLWLGGTTNSAKLPVEVSVTQDLAAIASGTAPIQAQQTWILELEGKGGLPEGNAIALASVDGVGAFVPAAVAIR